MWKTSFVIVAACATCLLLTTHPARAQMPNDSCEFANDGHCDEPGICPRGTDATDCGTTAQPDTDPELVEEQLNLSRSERRQIRHNLRQLGYKVTTGSSLNSRSVRRAIRNWQRVTGHEPTGYLTRNTADALLREIKVEQWPNSCDYAHDGTCDEPDLCDRGTDTDDCRGGPITPPPPPPQLLYCCDTNTGMRVCPIVVPGMVPGQICSCFGFVGYGLVCQ